MGSQRVVFRNLDHLTNPQDTVLVLYIDVIMLRGLGEWEGIGYPFQYSWTFLVAQLVKNLPAIRETRV